MLQLTDMDNRGSEGQFPPSNLTLSYPETGVAWLSGNQKNVAANFFGAPSSGGPYPAYPVFTIDTQKVCQ
ncbi:hypothetical protein [Endozoicomonas lisbonensis]|uniref:Uncharacterized protein n=1 Tax=Endozoicomonas lisbonensis TaxID=3120522 RepID=A0ABV2SF76_9GAMM